MKIRLMTFHTPKNYGAVLQAYSLLSVLKKYDGKAKIIDYNTPKLREKYSIIKKADSFRGHIFNILSAYTYPAKRKKYAKFDRFVKEKLDLTQRYESTQLLYENSIDADIVFTGSDQVFNPGRIEAERKAFYLDFAQGMRRVSYAGSFGVDDIPQDRRAEVKGYLDKFDGISVRESRGCEIVKELCGRDAVEVMDPVFLNDADFWRRQSKPYKLGLKKYIFYYRLMGARDSDNAAKKIANELGLPLVVMTDGIIRFKANKVLRDVGPCEFLDLINQAEFVVTDSFHGVAFSIIFNKQFVFSDTDETTRQRSSLLMQKLGIFDKTYINARKSGDTVEYKDVVGRLDRLIADSKEFIDESVKRI